MKVEKCLVFAAWFPTATSLLIYHGESVIEKEDALSLFPEAPLELLPYVPNIHYEILDIARISDSVLEGLHFLLLRNILLAFKHSRHPDYVEKNWEKIVIFAPSVQAESVKTQIWHATILYLSRTSTVFNEKIQEMENKLSASEVLEFKPFFQSLIEQGLEKGMEQGIEIGMEQGLEKGHKKKAK